jgi:hypothetical protein
MICCPEWNIDRPPASSKVIQEYPFRSQFFAYHVCGRTAYSTIVDRIKIKLFQSVPTAVLQRMCDGGNGAIDDSFKLNYSEEVIIRKDDLQLLNNRQWLNDTLVVFGLQYHLNRVLTDELVRDTVCALANSYQPHRSAGGHCTTHHHISVALFIPRLCT